MLVHDDIKGLRKAVSEVDFTETAVELGKNLRRIWGFDGVIEITLTVRGKGVSAGDGLDLSEMSATNTLTIPINHK